ncbi:hypothetical protein Pelo_12853 [Pelomyxa schiedti]|nr:hypothetical protein Pelo_12853 [Pelomyxa schiedti]
MAPDAVHRVVRRALVDVRNEILNSVCGDVTATADRTIADLVRIAPTRTLGPIHNTCGLMVTCDPSIYRAVGLSTTFPNSATIMTGASTAYGTSTASSTTRVASASENCDNGTEHAVGIMTQEHISISIPPTSTNSSTEDDFISLSEYGSDWSSFESPTPVTASCDSSHEADHTVMQQPSEGHQERKRGRYAGSHSLQPQHPKPRTTTTASSKPRTTTIKSPAALLKKNKQRRKKYAVILENSKTTATNSSLSTSEVPTFSPAQPEECEPPAYWTPENTLKYKELAIRKKEYLDKANTSDRKWVMKPERLLVIIWHIIQHALEEKADQYQLDLFILHCMKLRGYLQLTHEFEKKSGVFFDCAHFRSLMEGLKFSHLGLYQLLTHQGGLGEAVKQFLTWIDKRIIQPELQSKQKLPALTREFGSYALAQDLIPIVSGASNEQRNILPVPTANRIPPEHLSTYPH